MRHARLLLGAVIVLCAAAALRGSGPVGIFGIVEKVVFEPDERAPERIQVFGAFAYVRRQRADNDRHVSREARVPVFQAPRDGREQRDAARNRSREGGVGGSQGGRRYRPGCGLRSVGVHLRIRPALARCPTRSAGRHPRTEARRRTRDGSPRASRHRTARVAGDLSPQCGRRETSGNRQPRRDRQGASRCPEKMIVRGHDPFEECYSGAEQEPDELR